MSERTGTGAALRVAARPLVRRARRVRRRLGIAFGAASAGYRRADLSVFHEFAPAPTGGGHQFLRGLLAEFRRRGLAVENNLVSATTRACLLNSFNFDFERLRRLARPGCRIVHRVDGPIGVYRGWDDGTDRRIWEINRAVADATIFQSRYSLRRHLELGLEFADPVVVPNAPDPAVFHSVGRVLFSRERKIRLISASWSDNPNKGAGVIKWLESWLDWSRFEYTFVGRASVGFERIRALPPVPSHELASLFRQHDVFVTASLHEPCSNVLLEALACGLPALAAASGSNEELVGGGGLLFEDPEELPELLDRLVEEWGERRAAIEVPSLGEVADRYLAVLGLAG